MPQTRAENSQGSALQFPKQLVAIRAGGPSMPVYDYVCNDCQKTFELVLSLKEHDTEIKCPKCGSKNVEQEVTAFYTVTGKKS